MAQVKNVTATKDCKLDCGHQVKKGEEIVITSFYTTPRFATFVKAAVMGMLWALNPPPQKGDTPTNTKQPHPSPK